MFMYKLEIELQEQTVYLVVIAESDEKAFEYVEAQLTRHFIASPKVKSAAIVEKKRVEKGSGYVIETKG
jgi:hypothetical protein